MEILKRIQLLQLECLLFGLVIVNIRNQLIKSTTTIALF